MYTKELWTFANIAIQVQILSKYSTADFARYTCGVSLSATPVSFYFHSTDVPYKTTLWHCTFFF